MSEFQDKVDNIKKKVSRTSLYIGRIPEKTKTRFIEVANTEFVEDYGLCLKYCLEQSIEYQKVKKQLFKLIEQNDKNL